MVLNIRTSIAALALVSAATVGCNRSEPQAPPAQSATQTTQPLNREATVTGCLRAGDAADTFVLTTSQTENGVNPATYQLAGSGGVNLRDHVGNRIEVTGTLTEQQHTATTDARTPAPQQAEGTAGKASVQTGTQLAIRRMAVTAVRSAGGKCEQ